ncbi:DUF2612 domain-containing protein [Xylella fastidiosa]|uniref:DUF2612 domain-containing protein n=1 Tax=Xylella fastidiosa TaxID=2371 RepID=UPI001121AB16|nr:DUF2612 domain-containing protein [Xylella fastidiosa]TNV99895.1 hypothetical protein C5H21_01955 [Xylella fastidiosa]UIT40372.1 DUF2612 domain-containing protein [Xylella fastidiosa subsp. multiplex]
MSYADLLIWQYKGQPRATATAALISDTFSTTWNGLADLRQTLDIEKATGTALDLIGQHVGQSRVLSSERTPVRHDLSLDDAAYRFLIKCRIAKNHMTGTAPNMEEVLDFIFPGSAAVLDHYDMSYTVFVSTAMISDVIGHAITALDILPRPAGVRVRYNLVTHLPFGYERSNRNYTHGTFGDPPER